MLDICLLGTGGMMPLPNRWLSSALIRYKGKLLLIDCGEGTQVPIAMLKWGIKPISAVLFTHYHADHISGLPGLLLTIGNSGREKPLLLIGPKGLKEIVEGLTKIIYALPFELKLIELSDTQISQIKINELHIKSIPVDHNITCLAYKVDLKRQGKFDVSKAKQLDIPVNMWSKLQKGSTIAIGSKKTTPEMVTGAPRKGLRVCYCTDTRPKKELVEFIKGADLFICEGMYGGDEYMDKAANKKHMLFSEAAALAKLGGVKELCLTHFSPSMTEPEAYLDSARAIFPNTIIGKDMLIKKLRFED